ncbi:hypothetical protein D6851_04525 [Altericroceibacterium spongiae]|uniref:Uncharacterized protein n=1 Tax=Altericroceibacterium spongiae TaxID=2320269 RepID=A0A420EP89_9SPHN|nr:hypothetical protein [Altericroceibacterium spongiae]RKF22493.1 hypothetical protein D6851_04525 [Altericroceibacterium spongiae]
MTCLPRSSPAYRRYTKRFIPLTVFYIAAIMLASLFIPDDAAASPATIALALLPGLAVVGWIWAMGSLLVDLDDEYLRMLEVRKFLVATGFALAIASVWGLLELYTDVPKLPVFMIFPIWCLGLAVGQIWNRISGA